MPYIRESDREHINDAGRPVTAGQLNYAITRLIIAYTEWRGLSYATINAVRGAVHGAMVEYERRVAAPYEDRKIDENGDVYPRDIAPEVSVAAQLIDIDLATDDLRDRIEVLEHVVQP